MIRKRKQHEPIRAIFRKLGREKAYGLAFTDERIIEVDEAAHRGDEIKLLDTIAHEIIHCASPRLSEATVNALAGELAPTLYELGYRRIHAHKPKQEPTSVQTADTS